MIRYLGFIAVLMLFPAAIAMALGQEKQVLIIPLKIVLQDGKVELSPELSQAFASSLARDGDLKLQSGHVYRSAVERKKVDIRRIARIARQADVQAVVWGKLTISKDEMVWKALHAIFHIQFFKSFQPSGNICIDDSGPASLAVLCSDLHQPVSLLVLLGIHPVD